MENVLKGLIGLSVLAFALAVICSLTSYFFLGVSAEGYSRASSNLALLAIALAVGIRK